MNCIIRFMNPNVYYNELIIILIRSLNEYSNYFDTILKCNVASTVNRSFDVIIYKRIVILSC